LPQDEDIRGQTFDVVHLDLTLLLILRGHRLPAEYQTRDGLLAFSTDKQLQCALALFEPRTSTPNPDTANTNEINRADVGTGEGEGDLVDIQGAVVVVHAILGAGADLANSGQAEFAQVANETRDR